MLISAFILSISVMPGQPPASHLKRFAQYGPLTRIDASRDLALEFSTFLSLSKELRGGKAWPPAKAGRDANNTLMSFDALRHALRPELTEAQVRSALNELRDRLSVEDYRAGRMPPPVPPAYQGEFDRWRKDQAWKKSPKLIARPPE